MEEKKRSTIFVASYCWRCHDGPWFSKSGPPHLKWLFNVFQVLQLRFSSLKGVCLVPVAYKCEHHLSWPPACALLSIHTSFHGGSRKVYLHLPKEKAVQPMWASQPGFSNPLSSFLIVFSFSCLNFFYFLSFFFIMKRWLTNVEETWKIQNKATYTSNAYCNDF